MRLPFEKDLVVQQNHLVQNISYELYALIQSKDATNATLLANGYAALYD